MDLLRYAAFSDDPAAGNPAGVVLAAAGLTDAEMLAAAAGIGYSETAFLVGRDDTGHDIRYFSPLAEVPFCGHATVATAVALAERDGPGPVRFRTRSGVVPVTTAPDPDGRLTATLTSVDARSEPAADADVREALAALDWAPADLDPALPPHVAYAGAFHLVLAAATRDRLAALDYDFDRLGTLMAARDWTTLQLVWRQEPAVFQSRNPFPPGGVVEDPATGAAAAALGGYLREVGAIRPPAALTVFQGVDLGRPGRLDVTVPADRGGIDVRGTAVRID
ncbi:MAG: Phenazine biosynthesis protein PhzF like [uncultured Corynebacteriales bacterium]|uniref:Phenazine biosynthesis protein PhzF like n=1 Tax=uncultured Mycobacteriales bacterium TaxID=581187 RepID=A0A6J4JHJ4_9ACTN|nr:MAG: Phenazine biosynthesis protein PhzF like [uncultured Corynebacteriales bacterium]